RRGGRSGRGSAGDTERGHVAARARRVWKDASGRSGELPARGPDDGGGAARVRRDVARRGQRLRRRSETALGMAGGTVVRSSARAIVEFRILGPLEVVEGT